MTGYYLALDLGDVRVGLAKSDPLGMFATPLPFVPLRELESAIRTHLPACKGLVIGLPVNLKGETAQKAQWVETQVEKLRVAFPDLAIHLIDERFTTVIAGQKIRESGMPKKKREEKGKVDSWAAAEILQSFLDRQPR